MIGKILCAIGLHKFGEWRLSPLQALSNYHEWDYVRECARCKKQQYKHE